MTESVFGWLGAGGEGHLLSYGRPGEGADLRAREPREPGGSAAVARNGFDRVARAAHERDELSVRRPCGLLGSVWSEPSSASPGCRQDVEQAARVARTGTRRARFDDDLASVGRDRYHGSGDHRSGAFAVEAPRSSPFERQSPETSRQVSRFFNASLLACSIARSL